MTDLIESAANAIVGNPIPPALRKGFMKAVGRLLGAAVDVPAAKLEGYADEIRATSEARRSLVINAGKSLSENFATEAPIVQRAQARMVSKILREQVTVEDIVGMSAKILSESSIDKEPDEVSEDWWNTFESEAVTKSSDEMKEIFSQILAGEISNPGTYSIKAIKTISILDREVAASFNRLCSFAIHTSHLIKVLGLGHNAADNALQSFGLSFETLNQLQEYGLVQPDYNAYMDYASAVNFSGAISYVGRPAVLVTLEGHAKQAEVKLHGVTLSKVGRELFKIARITPFNEYSKSLSTYLKTIGHDLVFYDNNHATPIFTETDAPTT
jgi:hypothetical protein